MAITDLTKQYIAGNPYSAHPCGLQTNHLRRKADAGNLAFESISAGRKIPGQTSAGESGKERPATAVASPSTRYPHLHHRQSSHAAAAKRIDIGARATTRCFSQRSAINQLPRALCEIFRHNCAPPEPQWLRYRELVTCRGVLSTAVQPMCFPSKYRFDSACPTLPTWTQTSDFIISAGAFPTRR